jgi:hypothetical protein
MCKYLYEPDWIDYTPRTFWNSDSSVHDYVWGALEDNLDPALMSK